MRQGDGGSSPSCGSMSFVKKVMDRRRAVEKAKKGGNHTATSVTASPVSDILIEGECTGSGVSKAKDVSESESWGIVPSLTSAGVVANVPRRDGNVGSINKAKGRSFMEAEYKNTVSEQTPISAGIEHFVHTISALAVLFGIFFHIIDYAMGVNAIRSTVANVPEGLLLIGRTLNKRMLATNLDANAGDTMGTVTPNNLMNGTASPAPMFCSVLFCPFPHHQCNSNLHSSCRG